MVRPQFTRRRLEANLAESERHVRLVFAALGEPGVDGWTGDVDLLVSALSLTEILKSVCVCVCVSGEADLACWGLRERGVSDDDPV